MGPGGRRRRQPSKNPGMTPGARPLARSRSAHLRAIGPPGAALELLLALAVLTVAACSPGPVPTVPPLTPTIAGPTSPAAESGARLAVTFGGKIGCATFPYGCTAALSVLPAGTPVTADWRPTASEPWWAPDYAQGTTTDRFDPTPVGSLPTIPIGQHEIVISLLGSSDVPSYNPDGSRAFDLLGRCMSNVEVGSTTSQVDVLVTFTPDHDSFRASCVLEVTQRS